MAKLEGSAAANRYFENEKLRQQIRTNVMNESILAGEEGRELNTEYTDSLASIYESIPYTFKEQGYNQKYIKLLKEKYFLKHGKEFTGAGDEIKHLIDEDFADWNFVMNNLSMGMGSELLKNLAFASDEERANALARWQIFNATPSFDSPDVDDSRPFLDIKFPGDIDPNDEAAVQRAKDLGFLGFEVTGQLGDFIKGAGTDPLAYLIYGTGAGFMGKKLIEKGVSDWLAPKLGLSFAGAGYAGLHSTGQQMVGITAGSGEKYDPVKTLAHMGLGFAITPAISAIGSLVGPAGRAITHPKQSLNKVIGFMSGTKSEMAAAQGVMKSAQTQLVEKGSTGVKDVTQGLKDYLQQGYNRVDNYFNVMFDSVRSAPIKLSSVDNLVERWQMRFGKNYPLSESWDDLYANYLRGEAAKSMPHLNIKEVSVLDLARKLRREFYNANQKDKKDFQGNNRELIGQYKTTIDNIIRKGVKKADPEKGKLLDSKYALYKKQIEQNEYGKDLLAAAYSSTNEEIGSLLNKMLDKQFSWSRFEGAIKHFEKIDHIIGSKTKELAGGLRTKIEKAMSTFIVEAPNGAKIISDLLNTVDGRTSLKKMFPSMTKEWDDIIYMQKNLGEWGGAESVIGNMAMANMGGMVGKSIAGDIGGIWGGLLNILGWTKLMNSQYFKDAMVHAYKNNGGTLETSTRNWLMKHYKGVDGKKGLTVPQINAIQDTMWGYMYAGYALHGEDVLQERTGNKALDALNDLRVQYEHIMPEVRNLQLSSY